MAAIRGHLVVAMVNAFGFRKCLVRNPGLPGSSAITQSHDTSSIPGGAVSRVARLPNASIKCSNGTFGVRRKLSGVTNRSVSSGRAAWR